MADTGVVDPIRIPAWLREPFERAWREAPVVARGFVILAFVDVVSRGLGILQPRIAPGADLFAIYQMLIPHDLWILLPAVLVLRRPDAARATPLVFWGAVVAALDTALQRPIVSLFEDQLAGPTVLSLEVQTLGVIALLVAWVLIARGLAALNPSQPTPAAAGLSNIVLGLGGVAIAVAVGGYLVNGAGVGITEFDGVVTVGELVGAAQSAAWFYLLWVVIRGLGDTRRPAVATTVAAAGAVVVGLFDPSLSIGGEAFQAIATTFAAGNLDGFNALGYAMSLLANGVGEAALVVAFALGLAEPPVPYAARAASETPPTEPDPAILPG